MGYQEALQVTANLNGTMDALKDEIKAMGKQLAEEQGNISVYTDRQAKATATKATAEAELKDAQAVLSSEESSRVELSAVVKAHSGSVGVVKKEIEDIELAIAKVELEKGKYRNLEHELDGAREALDEEAAGRENVLRLTAKAEGEAQCWRQKYETDAVAKGEELEMTRMKLTARLTEAEAAIDNLNAKLNQVEKAKAKIAAESSDMANSLDQAQVLNAAMDRKAKQFDKVIGEWKGKVDRLSFDLDVSQKETRNASSELFKVKSAYEETMLQLEEVRRENKTLSNEIKDIMDQISEGGRSIHEIDKIRKRLEAQCK